jgi:DNA repair protein RadC
VLSDSELLAAILGAGAHTARGSLSAVDLARMLLVRYTSLRELAASDVDDLTGLPGIGSARSAQLAAAFELGRRVAESPEHDRAVLRGPADVVARFGPSMRDLHREIFKVVLINSAARVIRTFTASEGGLAASIVEPRLVFRRAILAHAASIICLHNHPSGNREPSAEDIRITRQLGRAGDVVGIPVRDHIIIAGDGYTSLAERGVLREAAQVCS